MAGAVHEVNNALQVIAGSVELLEQQPGLSAALTKSLDRIKRQAERAAAALGELQGFTKAPLDGLERFDVRETVTHAVSLRRYATARAGLTVAFDADGDAGALARGNAGLFLQAVLNVLINAEQAVAGTGGTITVEVLDENGRAGVRVSEAGPGVSDAVRPRLFEPFTSTREAREGAGLGLWAAHTILAASGGSVELTSAPTGTSVALWLPKS